MPTDPHNITLAILAGGEGSRMGGPKGMLRIDNKPILLHLLDRLRWSGPTLLVTAPGREHPAGWERFGSEAVDPVAGQGPLRGILTALDAAKTELLLVATVDMPGVHLDQLEALIHHAVSHPELDAVHFRREGSIEPFPSIYRRSAKGAIRRMLEANRRAVHRLADEAQVGVIEPALHWPKSVWVNLNEPADLSAFVNAELGERI